MVRQGTLTPSSAGSSPAIPAKHFRMAPHPVIYYAYAPLAQSVEHLPFKQGVWGSNPQRGTKKDATRSGGVFFGAPLSKKADGLFGQMNFAPNRAFYPPWAGKTHSGPTSTVGSAEASSFGPRPAQSVFCDVHAAAKNGFQRIHTAATAQTLRVFLQEFAFNGTIFQKPVDTRLFRVLY